MVGPYGAGTVFAPISPSRGLIRAAINLKQSRIGQALGDLIPSPNNADEQTGWRGMEMFLEQQVRFDDPGLTSVYDHYRQNLTAILDQASSAVVKTILCTVGTNLKDSAPFASLHRKELSEEQLFEWNSLYDAGIELVRKGDHLQALERFRRAEIIDDRFADLQYRMALSLLATGDSERAAEHFVKARDYDVLRFRADSHINNIIRDTAAGREDTMLFDVDRLFAEVSPLGIPGDELFYEHVHMNFQGNYLIAKQLLPLVEQIAVSPQSLEEPLSSEEVAQHLAFTDFDRIRVEKEVLTRMTRPPFTNQINHEAKQDTLKSRQDDFEKKLTQQARINANDIYVQAIRSREQDPWLYYNYGEFLEGTAAPSLLAEQFSKTLNILPGNVAALDKLALSLDPIGPT